MWVWLNDNPVRDKNKVVYQKIWTQWSKIAEWLFELFSYTEFERTTAVLRFESMVKYRNQCPHPFEIDRLWARSDMDTAKGLLLQ